ncbi:Fic family protein [Mycoplasmopsis opalescens]|uniref:Fic family protein n=1 Tax=Mycoplasmopsis opalescens TaxID=114886 RepID=UPI0004A6EB11|nr:Fic family protein [Mycoplasmopsis opalescens]
MKLTKMNRKQLDEIAILLTHSSCAIEGNTFTLQETRQVFKDAFNDIGSLKSIREVYEIINFKEVIEYIKSNYQDLEINKETILKLHKIVMTNLLNNNGSFRDHNVRINHSQVISYDWSVIHYKLDKLNDWYNQTINQPNINKKAVILEYHARFEKIHPFSDGNGRTGRAIILLQQFQNNLEFWYVNVKDKKAYLDALNKYHLDNDINSLLKVFKTKYTGR